MKKLDSGDSVNTRRLTLTLFAVALLLPLSFSAISPASAQGIVHAQPGATVWYEVDAFTLSANLLTEMEDEGSVDIDIDLAGSDIFAKILWVGEVSDEYGNAAQVVDVIMGARLGAGQSITALDPDEGDIITEITLPEGAGMFIPIGVSMATDFSETLDDMNMDRPWLPVPLYLSDDWAGHLLDLSGVEGVTPNDGAEYFTVAVDIDDDEIVLNGNAEWRKSDGVLYSVNLHVEDPADSTMYIDFGFSLNEIESPTLLPISVGDVLTYGLESAAWDGSFSGDFADGQEGFDEAKAEIEDFVGNDIIQFTITDIEGLYYEADIHVYDEAIGGLVLEEEGVWFNGFSNPDTFFYALAFAAVFDIGAMPQLPTEYGIEQSVKDFGPGAEAIPMGPVSVPDWEIYNSVSLTIEAILDQIEDAMLNAVAELEEMASDDGWDLDIRSSTGDDPQLGIHTLHGLNDGYNIRQIGFAVDVEVEIHQSDNDTWYDYYEGHDVWEYSEFDLLTTVKSMVGFGMVYSENGILQAIELDFELFIDIDQHDEWYDYWGNSGGSDSDGTMDIDTNTYVTKTGYTGPRPADGIDVTLSEGGDTDIGDTGDDALLPGFELLVAVLSLSGLVMLARKR